MTNIITQRNFNFNDSNKPEYWNNNLLKIKKEENFYKEYKIKIIDDKLFQTKIFFPSNTIPGTYEVNIYQVKNKIIESKKNKKIIIKKTGIGNKIFKLAHKQPATYGIICIIFAIFAAIARGSFPRPLRLFLLFFRLFFRLKVLIYYLFIFYFRVLFFECFFLRKINNFFY